MDVTDGKNELSEPHLQEELQWINDFRHVWALNVLFSSRMFYNPNGTLNCPKFDDINVETTG